MASGVISAVMWLNGPLISNVSINIETAWQQLRMLLPAVRSGSWLFSFNGFSAGLVVTGALARRNGPVRPKKLASGYRLGYSACGVSMAMSRHA